MNLLPGPFDFQDELTDEQLNPFQDFIIYNEYGEFEGFKKLDYISEVVDQVLKKPLQEGELERYIGGIKKNKKRQKNSKVKKQLHMVQTTGDASDRKTMYGTISEDLVKFNDGRVMFETAETVDKEHEVQDSIDKFYKLVPEFKRIEGVDLELVITRALEGVPKAVETLVHLTTKYPFLKGIIEDLMHARENGYEHLFQPV